MMMLNVVHNVRCQPFRFGLPSRIEPLTGIHKELQISQVAMTQRVIAAKALRQCGLQCEVDLGTRLRVIQVWERSQSRESNTRGAMAPREPEARRMLSQVWPI